jgi:hypothetical protein
MVVVRVLTIKFSAYLAPTMRDYPRRQVCHGKRPRAEFVRKPPLALPVKRSYNGKATTSMGLASSLDRNYRAFVKFESRAFDLQS